MFQWQKKLKVIICIRNFITSKYERIRGILIYGYLVFAAYAKTKPIVRLCSSLTAFLNVMHCISFELLIKV